MERRLNKLSWFWLLLLLTISFNALPQSNKGKKKDQHQEKKHQEEKQQGKKHQHQDCGGNCFSAEVLSKAQRDGGCTDYEMRVTHDGSCRYELSHFTVAIPCGSVSNISNSGGWANVIGKDPTTGLTGFKIDGVGNFGKNTPNFFTIKFTYCADSTCNAQTGCWQPRVAFKAATCVDYDTVSVSCEPSSLRASIQMQDASCFGNADGSLSVTVEGGVGPYVYSWSTGCTSSSVENVPAGTYTVTITDANGEVVTVTEEIVATSQIVLSGTTVNPLCSGGANGAINLTVTGGQEPYTYIWSNGATTEDLTNLAAGNYQVTVTDLTGCSRAANFQLTSPQILVSAQLLQPACTQTNGGIDITVTGGAEPYTYLWNNGATTQDVANLAAGTFNVVVTDANGCTRQSSFLLRENNTLRIAFAVTPTSCVGSASGAIDITVTGGTTPYTYLWANGSISEDLTGLSSGLQRITVTDAGGCTATSNINVFRESFSVASQVSPPTCTGETDGFISLTPSGVPPFTYLWSTGATTSSISNLTQGVYTVTVTDNTGCSRALTFPISDPVITASSSVGNLQCGAEGAFSIDLTVTGGVAPYTYEWSNGETTQDISGLNSGTYTVTITDSNGCSRTAEVVVVPVVITWSCLITPPTENPVCGSSENPLGTSVTDGSYAWSVQSDDGLWVISSGQNSASILYAAGGEGSSATFTVAITKGGCTQTCSFTLSSCSPVLSCGDENSSSTAPAIVAEAEIVADSVIQAAVVDSVTHTSIADAGTQTGVVDTDTQNADDDAADEGKEEEKDAEFNQEPSPTDFQLVAYPNPVVDRLNFGWTADADEFVRLELIDIRGARIAELFSGYVHQGQRYSVEWSATNMNDPLCIYHFSSGTHTVHGKVLKR